MEQATRIINWDVSRWMLVLLYGGSALAVSLSIWRLLRRISVWRRGLPMQTQPTAAQALGKLSLWVLGRGKMQRDPYAAIMHWLILWGFIILFIGTTLVFLEHQTPLHFFYGPFYLAASAVIDLGGAAFLVGLALAFYRRYGRRTARLRSSPMVSSMLILLAAIGVSGFFLEAARIAVDFPAFEKASLIGYPLACALRETGSTSETMRGLHQILWVGHAVLSLVFFGLAMGFFFRHSALSALTVALSPVRSSGALRPYPLLGEEGLGKGRVSDLMWTDLLDADACTTCGRCTSVCPATAAGKELDPRLILLKLGDLIDRAARRNGIGGASALDTITAQELWDCTTCGACNAACPVDIQVFDKIIDLRRQLVDLAEISGAGQSALEGIRIRQNPWEYPPAERSHWRENLKLPIAQQGGSPEWVYWIGCAGAYEPAGQSVSRSTAAILSKAGVNYALLGSEHCTGDPARRLGDEGLFHSCRQKNLDLLRSVGARKIVTHCPHCMNTFRNEYMEGEDKPEFEIVHHSELLANLVAEGKIVVRDRGVQRTVTYHDPCYLGRHNGMYDAPRALVDSVPGLRRVEMERSREQSFCCGGGGGQMWLESSGRQRVEGIRLLEAESTGASVIATACPFCKVMLESASATAGKQEKLQVRDLSEIIYEAMER